MEMINDLAMDFNSMEKEVYRFVCKLGVKIIEECMSSIDLELSKGRDKEAYRHKGLKTNTVKTVMGPVQYRRAIYENINEEGVKSYVYLLDEAMGMKTIGKLSGMLAEKVLENVSHSSYRRSAENVSSLTGQSISHGGVWNLVQGFGEKLERDEQEKIELHKAGKLKGQREVEVLFKEADGLWLNMQGKDKPKGGKSTKREIKLGIHYEGWIKRNGKKEKYIVKNKGIVAGFTDSKTFKETWDARIAENYNVDEIKYQILNGDGAAWIKTGHDNIGDYFQLDRFHIARAILRQIKDKKEAKNLWKLFKKSQFRSFMERLTELKFECGGVYEEVKKIEVLENYLKSNKEGISPYQQRIKLPEPPEGIYYRNLGTMEHNIFDVLGCRMKGQKMSWSVDGANHLSKILAEKASGKLYEKIKSLLSSSLPEKAKEVFETALEKIKEKTEDSVTKLEKKINLYPLRHGKMPFTGSPLTEGRKAIRKILSDRLATELIYR
jgi:hypothetical protein